MIHFNPLSDSIINERSPLIKDTHKTNGDPVVTEFTPSHDYGPGKEFLYSINPIDIDGWSDKNLFKKIYDIFKVDKKLFFVYLTNNFFFSNIR